MALTESVLGSILSCRQASRSICFEAWMRIRPRKGVDQRLFSTSLPSLRIVVAQGCRIESVFMISIYICKLLKSRVLSLMMLVT